MLLVVTALALGALHSFAPDHLAAVSVFVSRHPSWRRAMSLGARWGVGHSLTIVLLGGAISLTGLRLPERFAPSAERAVGVTLVLIGVVALARALRARGHAFEQAHAHDRGHGALLGIGVLHGLAGSGALVVALPSAVAASRAQVLLCLGAFGIGTIVSMAVAGAVAGHALGAAVRSFARARSVVAVGAAALSMIVGVWWIASGGTG
ncbi:MAG: hypothetical protein ABJD07_00840 [Gemmatimonadaceae bacterium]